MQRLSWREPHGEVSWSSLCGRWFGAWERREAYAGLYASSRQSMIAFLLDGEVDIELGPRRLGLGLRAGDALLIQRRTPFRYRMAAGTRLVVTELAGVHDEGLGLHRLPARRLPRGMSNLYARAWDDRAAMQRLGERGHEARALEARVLPFEPVHNSARILGVKRHLDMRYQEPLRLREVARAFGMDRFYLSREFAKTVGFAPMAYLQALRREHFLRALVADDRSSLTRLALDAGFGDYPTFCRRMRRELGVTPSALQHSG
jgi:AraC-like DNA-binding protein